MINSRERNEFNKRPKGQQSCTRVIHCGNEMHADNNLPEKDKLARGY